MERDAEDQTEDEHNGGTPEEVTGVKSLPDCHRSIVLRGGLKRGGGDDSSNQFKRVRFNVPKSERAVEMDLSPVSRFLRSPLKSDRESCKRRFELNTADKATRSKRPRVG